MAADVVKSLGVKSLTSDAQFFEETINVRVSHRAVVRHVPLQHSLVCYWANQSDKIRSLLNNTAPGSAGIADKIAGMKYLLAVRCCCCCCWRCSVLCVCVALLTVGTQLISKGRNAADFYPDVVKNVVVKSVELKKLVYMYLVHHTVRVHWNWSPGFDSRCRMQTPHAVSCRCWPSTHSSVIWLTRTN